MARPKNTVPTYRLHKPSQTARCWFSGRWVTLGKYNSPESRAEYARIVAELAVSSSPTQVVEQSPTDITVNELLIGFWRYAERHYRRPDGSSTNELPQFKQTFRLVREIYGYTPAKEFGPLALQALRQKMIDVGWTRKLINQRVGRVRRVFQWAVRNELIPVAIYQALKTVEGLQAGRTEAKESDPVLPIEEGHVVATLPFLQPALRAMVEVHLRTGMRPGEVCQLRPCDIDTSGPVWMFRPNQFKTQYLGKPRIIAIGPKAQGLLTEFTPLEPTDYFFSPRRVVAAFHAERTANRTTPRYPSHCARNSAKRVEIASRQVGVKYTVTSYDRAISRAVLAANNRRKRMAAGGEFDPIPHWHPNQLRHTHATQVRKKYGLEAAQVSLGHSHATITEVYAEKNIELAIKVAAEVG